MEVFTQSFIWYTLDKMDVLCIAKFTKFTEMSTQLKASYKHLSQHLLQQTQYQKPNQVNSALLFGNMYNLVWCKVFTKEEKLGVPGISKTIKDDWDNFVKLQTEATTINSFLVQHCQEVSLPVSHILKEQHDSLDAPSLIPFFQADKNENTFTSHLSYTLNNLTNTPHVNNNISTYKFLLWMPINKDSVKPIESDFKFTRGNFAFPKDGFMVDSTNHNGVVEIVMKATSHYHYTLPSTSVDPHTQLGLSCELPF